MKNRLLPLTFVILTLGFAGIFLSAKVLDKDKSTSAKKNSHESYLNRIRNNQVTGTIDPADVFKAREQIASNKMFKSSREFNLDWVSRGPNNLGGRTRALLIDNQDPSGNTVYTGSVTGGLFKSLDGVTTWHKINIENSNLRLTCLAQASNGNIYAGTGEGFTSDEYNVTSEWGYESGFLGQGMFKSTDGETFSLLTATAPTDTTWGFINELTVGSSDRVFAATNATAYNCSFGNTSI